jgi:hypothetical protein
MPIWLFHKTLYSIYVTKISALNVFLKDSVMRLRMAIIGNQKTDQKNFVLPEHIFNYFQRIFMF